jgi:hypothetical protein
MNEGAPAQANSQFVRKLGAITFANAKLASATTSRQMDSYAIDPVELANAQLIHASLFTLATL